MVALVAEAEAGELARGPCELRGWEARTLVDDRAAGRVRALLADPSGAVRWLALTLASGRCVLLPAGQARADRAGPCVWIPGFAADQLELLPAYDPGAGPPDAVQERALLAAFSAALLRERPAPAEPAGAGGADGSGPGADPRLDAATLFGDERA